jgi:hypothetical protein
MDGIHKMPEFRQDYARVERSPQQQSGKGKQDQGQKKKKQPPQKDVLFENLADSLGQYQQDPFQAYG